MVAWHEVPGKVAKSSTVPEGRYDWLPRARRICTRCLTSRFEGPPTHTQHGVTLDHTVPTGRISIWRSSRHFVPGYHRFVPPGQAAASLLYRPAGDAVAVPLGTGGAHGRTSISEP
jgi:hypothetical protein